MQSEYDYFNLSFVVRLSFPALSCIVIITVGFLYLSKLYYEISFSLKEHVLLGIAKPNII